MRRKDLTDMEDGEGTSKEGEVDRGGVDWRQAEERCKRRRRGVAERAEGNPPP